VNPVILEAGIPVAYVAGVLLAMRWWWWYSLEECEREQNGAAGWTFAVGVFWPLILVFLLLMLPIEGVISFVTRPPRAERLRREKANRKPVAQSEREAEEAQEKMRLLQEAVEDPPEGPHGR
jgi:hypothetical protein